MPALKDIEYKEINGIKVDKENDEAFFNDETHTYYNKETMQKYVSVTTLIHGYSQEFDENFWSSYKALEAILPEESWMQIRSQLLSTKKIPKNLFSLVTIDKDCYEAKKQEIIEDYARRRNEACERGTEIHSRFENSFYGNKNIDFKKFGCGELKGDFQCKKDYYKLDLKQGVYPEFFISLISRDGLLRVAGQVDLCILDGNDVYIIDFKTNKEIKKTSFYNKNKKSNEMMKFPLNNLQDCNFNHYQLQLSTYAYMLKQINPEYNIKKLLIYHIDHDGNETIIPCEYLKDDVERMLKHYKKQSKIHEELERIKPVQIC